MPTLTIDVDQDVHTVLILALHHLLRDYENEDPGLPNADLHSQRAAIARKLLLQIDDSVAGTGINGR